MIQNILTVLTLVSVFFFPWPLTAILTGVLAFFVPVLPLAVGILYDTLYYIPGPGSVPVASLIGAAVTAIAIIVRNQLNTGIIRE